MPRPPDLDDPSSRSTAILKAISNQRRLQILNHLSDGTERSVSEIEQLVPDLSQSALSQHLGRLRQAEIVKTRRVSQTIFYSIEDQNVVRILRLLKQIYIEDPAYICARTIGLFRLSPYFFGIALKKAVSGCLILPSKSGTRHKRPA